MILILNIINIINILYYNIWKNTLKTRNINIILFIISFSLENRNIF